MFFNFVEPTVDNGMDFAATSSHVEFNVHNHNKIKQVHVSVLKKIDISK